MYKVIEDGKRTHVPWIGPTIVNQAKAFVNHVVHSALLLGWQPSDSRTPTTVVLARTARDLFFVDHVSTIFLRPSPGEQDHKDHSTRAPVVHAGRTALPAEIR